MIIQDVIIPFHTKDIPTIKLCCDSLLDTLSVKRIFLVSKVDPKIKNTIFIDELSINSIISYKEIYNKWVINNANLANRSGWIYQQLLKLGANDYINDLSDNYLVCDSDIIFLKNIYIDTQDGEFPYSKAFTGEYHEPYKKNYFSLLKENPIAGFSFINHNMVYNKKNINDIKSYIEKVNGCRWDKAILNSLDYYQSSNFSEYDLYGNWMFKYKRNNCKSIKMNIAQINYIPNESEINQYIKADFDIISSQEWIRK